MANWYELPCGRCGENLDTPKPIVRRIPERGGKKAPVCRSCASEIDRQIPLLTEELALVATSAQTDEIPF